MGGHPLAGGHGWYPLLPIVSTNNLFIGIALKEAAVIRRVATIGILLGMMGGPIMAQEWANKMFDEREHDFGVVARGAKTEFRFKFRNLYKEDLHVESVRSSCGCTIPSVTKRDLKTWDESEVLAEFNTRQYYGDRSATVTVTFDKPFRAQVQLNVKGKIRGDVVVEPGKVDFGDIEAGRGAERKLAVSYAGRDTWKLVDVKSANPYLSVVKKETGRGGGKVSYDLTVQLTREAPSGFINDQLYLVTNDPKNSDLPIEVVGHVRADVIVKPDQIYLGSLRTGQRKPLNLTVTGKRELMITKIECDDDCFHVERPRTAKKAQLIQVTFTARDEPGKHSGTITIYTNQGSEPLKVPYFVQVLKAEPVAQISVEPASESDDELEQDDQPEREPVKRSTATPTFRARQPRIVSPKEKEVVEPHESADNADEDVEVDDSIDSQATTDFSDDDMTPSEVVSDSPPRSKSQLTPPTYIDRDQDNSDVTDDADDRSSVDDE